MDCPFMKSNLHLRIQTYLRNLLIWFWKVRIACEQNCSLQIPQNWLTWSHPASPKSWGCICFWQTVFFMGSPKRKPTKHDIKSACSKPKKKVYIPCHAFCALTEKKKVWIQLISMHIMTLKVIRKLLFAVIRVNIILLSLSFVCVSFCSHF